MDLISIKEFCRLKKEGKHSVDELLKMHLGFDIKEKVVVHRFGCLVRTYTRDSYECEGIKKADGSVSLIVTPPKNVQNDKYMSSYGLVVYIGPTAFNDKEIFPYGPTFEVGDIVNFDKQETQRADLNGVPFRFIVDERVKMTIKDVEAITFDDKLY